MNLILNLSGPWFLVANCVILQIGDGLALNSSDFHGLTVSKSTQEWKLIRKSASQGDAKPATSCHMTYIPKLESVSDCTSWDVDQ